jgi:phosphoribosylformylglycinamidine (FGAM) synthase-like enzyme
VGAEIELASSASPLPLVLFGEGPSRIVVSVPAHGAPHFERLMGEFTVPWRWIGRVGGDRLVIRTGGGAPVISVSLQETAQAWRSGFERYVG